MKTARTSAPDAKKDGGPGDLLPPERFYSYRAFLLAQSEADGLRKGMRTDLRIRWAACDLLERVSLEGLKMQDICVHTKIAQGTIYQYFADRDRLLAALLQDFVVFVRERMESSTQKSSTHEESTRLATLTYCRLFEHNRGLMKCLLNHYETFPEARSILQTFNRQWIETVVKSIRKRRGVKGSKRRTSGVELLRRAYALGGMVDQYLSYIYLYADENVTAVAGDTDTVVRTLTYIWNQTFAQEFDDAQ